MTIALELPQTTDLLDPTAKLSSGFIKSLPIPVGLWCPSKLRNTAADFNPLKKNFGTLNGGITTTPGGFGTLGQAWKTNGSSQNISITSSASIQIQLPFTFWAVVTLSSSGSYPAIYSFASSVSFSSTLFFGCNSTGGTFSAEIGGTKILDVFAFAPGTPTFVAGSIGASSQLLVMGKNGAPLQTSSTANTIGALTYSGAPYVGSFGPSGGYWPGSISAVALHRGALSIGQLTSLYNCLLTGKPFPLFEPDTLYIDEPQTASTINLTSKSFVFSSSNSQASIQRNINSQSDSLSDSQGNITFTRDLKSTLESRSFSSSATSVLRPLVSELISQSESGAAETRQILASSIIASQSFSSGKFALSAFINLESTVFAESFSYVEINLSKALNSTGFSLSDLLAEISVKRNLSSIGLSLSDSISQETVLRPLDSESISQAKDHAEISIERLLTSEILFSSLAKGQFTTQLYTKFEVLSYRRYSSQYFVQSGSVNDSGQ